MPNDERPPKKWWVTCIQKVEGTDKKSVCGSIWTRIFPVVKKRIIKNKEPFSQPTLCFNRSAFSGSKGLDLKKLIPMSRSIIEDSRECVKRFPSMIDHPNACEVGILPTLAQNATLHTHTFPKAIEPSDRDIQTTNELGKKFLCIANSADGELICFSKSDEFQNPVFRKKIL